MVLKSFARRHQIECGGVASHTPAAAASAALETANRVNELSSRYRATCRLLMALELNSNEQCSWEGGVKEHVVAEQRDRLALLQRLQARFAKRQVQNRAEDPDVGSARIAYMLVERLKSRAEHLADNVDNVEDEWCDDESSSDEEGSAALNSE